MLGELLDFFYREIFVICTAMVPIIELRGAIPIGVGMGLSPVHAAVLGVIGSSIPVPFILFFLRPILNLFYRTSFGTKIANYITRHITSKDSKIKKYRFWGLYLFVAVPLPTTGAWTGSGAAVLMDMRIRDAMLAIFLGNCTAAVIMMLLSGTIFSVF